MYTYKLHMEKGIKTNNFKIISPCISEQHGYMFNIQKIQCEIIIKKISPCIEKIGKSRRYIHM